jgi:hypothetical protein
MPCPGTYVGLSLGFLSLPGTDVIIFKIFSPKNSAKKLAFLTQNKAKLCKNLIITLVFKKKANFLPKFVQDWGSNSGSFGLASSDPQDSLQVSCRRIC